MILRPRDRSQGLIETLLVLDGTPIELDAHLGRLRGSARDVYEADLPPHTRELAFQRAEGLAVGRMRLTVRPGPAGDLAVEAVSAAVDPGDVFPGWERAIALRPFPVPGGLGDRKWADRSGLPWTEPAGPGWLPLAVDGDEVLEASRANLFAVEDGTLVTPAADGRLLPGVGRARAIAIAGALGIEVREEGLTTRRLLAAGEAFLTGSVRGVEPVGSLGEAEFGPPSEAVAALAAEMRRTWSAEGVAPRPQPSPVGSA